MRKITLLALLKKIVSKYRQAFNRAHFCRKIRRHHQRHLSLLSHSQIRCTIVSRVNIHRLIKEMW